MKRTTIASVLAAGLMLAACGDGKDPGQVVVDGSPLASTSAAPSASAPEASEPAASEAPVGKGIVQLKAGFGQGEYSTYASVIFKNDSGDQGGSVSAQFTAYDKTGQVVGTGEDSVPAVRAGATHAIGTNLDVPEGSKVARLQVVLSTSGFQTDPHPTSVFTGRGVRYASDGFGGGKAQGELVSSYTSSVTDVKAEAVCFNAAGAIVGGGFTFVDLVPGGQAVGVSVDVTTSVKPARCAVYAAVSNLSQEK